MIRRSSRLLLEVLAAVLAGFLVLTGLAAWRLSQDEPVRLTFLTPYIVEALTPADLDRTITIRGEAFLVYEALSRSMTHTAYHVCQIVYVARHLASGTWKSLSIPKGQSPQAGGDYKTRGIAR